VLPPQVRPDDIVDVVIDEFVPDIVKIPDELVPTNEPDVTEGVPNIDIQII
jgi:hypothetical protein